MTQAALLATAISQFVAGCKTDGIWDPIKACCIMAAWDGLAGALYPLKGPAPTNNNFVAGDYNRETGLVGDGSTKYLNSNRANNADPQDSNHNAFYRSSSGGVTAQIIATNFVSGENTFYDNNLGSYNIRNRSIVLASNIGTSTTGFAGVSRSNNSSFVLRSNGTNSIHNIASQTPTATFIGIFGVIANPNNPGRLAFYSIGESLDLEKLDTRVTRLIQQTAFSINTGLDGSIYDIDTLRYVNAGYAAGGTLT